MTRGGVCCQVVVQASLFLTMIMGEKKGERKEEEEEEEEEENRRKTGPEQASPRYRDTSREKLLVLHSPRSQTAGTQRICA